MLRKTIPIRIGGKRTRGLIGCFYRAIARVYHAANQASVSQVLSAS
jgi:hypothetical protein